jgi:hypothetical protein
MSAQKVGLIAFAPSLVAILGVGLAAYTFLPHASDGKPVSATNSNCAQARTYLREADRCFANALEGLQQTGATKQQIVLGDRRLVSTYMQRIAAIRERLQEVVNETDAELGTVVLPEIIPNDED